MKKLSIQFENLEKEGHEILKTKKSIGFGFSIDDFMYKKWALKAKNLISITSGEDSVYYKGFVEEESKRYTGDMLTQFDNLRGILSALKEDYENGYLISSKALIEADVFDNELEQAKELLEKKYKLPSAVIAGTVLETALRSLCTQNSIGIGKLDKMNADLAKKGVYNRLYQKRITALADIRNSAAHGKDEEFNHEDVKTMIMEIERFLENYLLG